MIALRTTAAITSGEEETMTDEKNAAEPSGASGGSVVCPYVTGTVTRYCTLTPFTLTDAEREAVELASSTLRHMSTDDQAVPATLRGLLERLT